MKDIVYLVFAGRQDDSERAYGYGCLRAMCKAKEQAIEKAKELFSWNECGFAQVVEFNTKSFRDDFYYDDECVIMDWRKEWFSQYSDTDDDAKDTNID